MEAAGDLTKIGKVIDALVSAPDAGRPPQVQALNGAAITLLSGHLQGFLVDLHDEAARVLCLENVNRLFASLGFREIRADILALEKETEGLLEEIIGTSSP